MHILQHSLGVDQYGQGEQYRNSFVADLDREDGKLCSKLVNSGFMKDFGPQKNAGGMNFFKVTDLDFLRWDGEPEAPENVDPYYVLCWATNDLHNL